MVEVFLKFLETLPPVAQRAVIILITLAVVVYYGASIKQKMIDDHTDTIKRIEWLKGGGEKRDTHLSKLDEALIQLSRNQASIAQFDADMGPRVERLENYTYTGKIQQPH